MIRFVHTSDLHLGKPFGRFPEDVRVRLRQARADAVPRLAAFARGAGASHILLAGDTFDQTTPAPTVIRQALNAMRAASDVIWVMMPGNHDHANAAELWRQVQRDAPPNVVVLLAPAPFALTERAVILPAPPAERHPGRDLTDWFDSAATGDALRIGLAHGSVTDFEASEEGGSAVIAADRARRAGLAYLALGDWHGQLQIGPQTWYSGAPEADGFRHRHPPGALLVQIAGPGAMPEVTPQPTGSLVWQRARIDLLATDDPARAQDQALPPLENRAATLIELQFAGRIRAPARVALEQAVARAAPDFLWHRADFADLRLAPDQEDLDMIDRQGALRAAADALSREASDAALAPDQREAAADALAALFSYAAESE